MHIHILGICGTFMGGIAVIAKQAGHRVTGCDANVYPPMSTQLEAQGIELIQGFGAEQVELKPDVYVIGNVVTRGKQPLMEAILDRGLPYISGPQWLYENILGPQDVSAQANMREAHVKPQSGGRSQNVRTPGKWVLAVAGTHGKTTTSGMLAWILEDAKLNPGYLVGGVPRNFGVSARLTESPFFVIEADEYDTAFFDKRSKFVHYRPRTVVLNNLEYDHADIFPDLGAIETQFHHLVRTVPGNGLIIANGREASLERVLARGCWTPVERFGSSSPQPSPACERGGQGQLPSPTCGGGQGGGWQAVEQGPNAFDVLFCGQLQGRVEWELLGEHNRMNALAAIAAARHAGVPVKAAIEALGRFQNVKRRLELRGEVNGITVYDDFAHHPTAIETTVAGLRAKVDGARILAVLEPRSNTMKLGTMKAQLPASLKGADAVFCYAGGVDWDVAGALAPLGDKAMVQQDLDALIEAIARAAKSGDHVLIMSNGGFGGIHDKLLARLAH
ncbi:UDP-N-acetylmuramate: L-alanyl-gamma-D-glutamyl-meso-diaminopimelate ligase [Sulfuritortus calidifontis]|uniref:UDP-N-acetylmuramate--L-alanyl-gamma-D-glutamyl-meso-2,6-diaminoheptandioate ligase n=1 Tax=Sulfuritortus calidifontis TaxID=1914471 RepID=A0A4R3JRD9_9PROT|nr:Mur ligase domain-containing protein [Sulfuritortus calidifontis]TCS69474.1 UDP-N-acetylmuramate: L-alanyl-gamma-D-glutamyl-meso-diaminopimelate ligase [Sulfuritortus calidifontis]